MQHFASYIPDSQRHPLNHWRRKNDEIIPESEFNGFEPRLKSAKTRFQLSAGLTLETFNTIFSGINHIWVASQTEATAQIH